MEQLGLIERHYWTHRRCGVCLFAAKKLTHSAREWSKSCAEQHC